MARVATKGTAQATASSDQLDGGLADKGNPGWTAGEVLETTDPKLSVGGVAVVHQATCTFTFAGTKGAPPTATPIADISTVTLSPGQTTLQAGQADTTSVLLDGDSNSDTFGNRVKVSVPASSKLASS
jgi:hypothetical protein